MAADDFDRIYDKLDKIDTKIDTVVTHASSVDITLARNTDSLVAHMERTAIIEKALFPIKRLYDFGVVAIQILGIIGISAAIIEGIVALLTYIHGR